MVPGLGISMRATAPANPLRATVRPSGCCGLRSWRRQFWRERFRQVLERLTRYGREARRVGERKDRSLHDKHGGRARPHRLAAVRRPREAAWCMTALFRRTRVSAPGCRHGHSSHGVTARGGGSRRQAGVPAFHQQKLEQHHHEDGADRSDMTAHEWKLPACGTARSGNIPTTGAGPPTHSFTRNRGNSSVMAGAAVEASAFRRQHQPQLSEGWRS